MSWLTFECMSAKSIAEGLCSASLTSTHLIMSLTRRGSSRMVAGGCPSASSFGTRRVSWGSFAVPAAQACVSVKRTKANNLFIPGSSVGIVVDVSWIIGHFIRTKDVLATAMYLCSDHRHQRLWLWPSDKVMTLLTLYQRLYCPLSLFHRNLYVKITHDFRPLCHIGEFDLYSTQWEHKLGKPSVY